MQQESSKKTNGNRQGPGIVAKPDERRSQQDRSHSDDGDVSKEFPESGNGRHDKAGDDSKESDSKRKRSGPREVKPD